MPKSSLVTGASSGLGRELAILFSRDGSVILSGRNEEELRHTRDLCKDPANIIIVCGDLHNLKTQTRLVHCAARFSIHYLICCAGEYLDGLLETIDPLRAERVLDTNLTATISLIRPVYALMAANLYGTIIHANSIAGKAINAKEAVYAASKHGMAAFLKALRFEARQKNVRILDVFLGAMQTQMCEGRDNFDSLMSAQEVAYLIHSIATITETGIGTLQVEELHLGRFPS